MPWRPDDSVPDHPVQRYNLRVARIERAGGGVVGYALVERQVFWRQVAGTLWWRRFGNPETCAVIDVILHGECEERFLLEKDLDAEIPNWDRDLWIDQPEDGRRVEYSLTWLPSSESKVVAQRELGVDVEWLRRAHRHQGDAETT